MAHMPLLQPNCYAKVITIESQKTERPHVPRRTTHVARSGRNYRACAVIYKENRAEI
jgi:hypothetical protein